MARPWRVLDRIETPDGPLELRARGDDDLLITVAGRVLMNSRASRSEEALARHGCAPIQTRPSPRVLIGGLGMGCTVRAALDQLPPEAVVCVCELHSEIAAWCRGPLASVNGEALADRRVEVILGDVAAQISGLAEATASARFDAILLDLYEGPHAQTPPRRDPFYGGPALERTRRALAGGGVFAVWSEAPDAAFERRLGAAGFVETRLHRPGRGGLRHAVYVARRGP